MRYQYPATTPFGHYWEEESVRIWGIRLWISKKAGFYLNYILGEVVLANLFLLVQMILNQRFVLGFERALTKAISRIDLNVMLKRSFDIGGAAAGLVLTLPFWLVIAVAIKLDSRGPVFYRQERVGQDRRRRNRRAVSIVGIDRRALQERRQKAGYGRVFMIIKFRSMCHDAESLTGPTWARKNDSRVTRFGRMLRTCRIDELPQLLNVLLGDMSLVGPRPERPCFVGDLNGVIRDYTRRFEVKPGITGLAQVEHKYDECLEDVSKKITYDLRYIGNWTVFQDFKIIMRTVVVVLTARGM